MIGAFGLFSLIGCNDSPSVARPSWADTRWATAAVSIDGRIYVAGGVRIEVGRPADDSDGVL